MTTVLVTSENTRPSESLPIKRMGTCLEIRPLRRTLWSVILATWGRGQEFYCFHDSQRRKGRPKISKACCEKSTAEMAIAQARAGNKLQEPHSLSGAKKEKKRNSPPLLVWCPRSSRYSSLGGGGFSPHVCGLESIGLQPLKLRHFYRLLTGQHTRQSNFTRAKDEIFQLHF